MKTCLSWWNHFVRAPRLVGSILPSSPHLADNIARRVVGFAPLGEKLRLIEVGAGTGAITRALAKTVDHTALTLVEADSACCRDLRCQFPRAHVAEGLIEEVVEQLILPCQRLVLVSSVPLFSLKRPQRDRVLAAYETLASAATHCRVVQYTYAPWLPGRQARRLCGHDVNAVWQNIPPAWVWSSTHVN